MLQFTRFARPRLEALENRLVPAGPPISLPPGVTIKLFNGTLLVVGDNAGRDIDFIRNAAGLSVSVNGGAALQFRASNLIVQTGNGPDDVSLQWTVPAALAGNVTIRTGNGDDIVSINDNSSAIGRIGGNLTILTGLGNDALILATDNGLTVGGNAFFDGGGGGGDQVLAILDNTEDLRIGGRLSLNEFEVVLLDGNSSVPSRVIVGRDLVVTNVAGGEDSLFLFDSVVVGRNLSITAGAGCDTAVLVDITVAGNLLFHAADGDNIFDFETLVTGSFVRGNVIYTGGIGDDLIDLEDNLFIDGDAAFDVGGGDNAFANCDSAFVIGGNLLFRAGDGDNVFVDDFEGTVQGNLTIQFGNGMNFFLFDEGIVGGALRLRLGNGDNVIEIDAGGTTLILDLLFGSGITDLTLDDGFFTGRIVATTGTLLLTQDPTAILLPNFVLIGG